MAEQTGPATVADLIEALRSLPQDAMVVMSKDAEDDPDGWGPSDAAVSAVCLWSTN